jgi:hypothetical protein
VSAFFYDTPIDNAGRERVLEGLRKAGCLRGDHYSMARRLAPHAIAFSSPATFAESPSI